DDGGLVCQSSFRAKSRDRGAKAVDDRKPARNSQQLRQPGKGALTPRAERAADRSLADRLAGPAAPQPGGDTFEAGLAREVADPLASDDQFATLAIDMAQNGFGGGHAVEANRGFRQLDVHLGLLFLTEKVGPLDRLINLDYVNQYEKISRTLPLGPGGLRRTRYLAGNPLRLCQPRPDPLRAVGRFAQPPLPRRGRPHPEGSAHPGAGAAWDAQFRRRSAGDGFSGSDHHRGWPDLSRRELR